MAGAWRRILATAIRDLDELWRVLELPEQELPAARAAATGFPLIVPRGFVARMRRGDLRDPLLRQVLPTADELVAVPGFGPDPLAEEVACATPGLLRKYHGRALLITAGACAVHCRYCFRRHFPYAEVPRGRRWWAEAWQTVADDPSVEELLLSGGDPLVLPDPALAALAADFTRIPHLRRLRIHTRLPVVIPERVDGALLDWLRALPVTTIMVIHANHPAEIDPAVAAACRRLRRAGVQLFNQAVLLEGVNADAAVLGELCRRLGDIGVVPYYLHQLDRVAGAAHFEVPVERAAAVMRDLHRDLPGYLLPRLVQELPGAPGKTHLPW